MVHYAECAGCRRRELLAVFWRGLERRPPATASRTIASCRAGGRRSQLRACDNCLSPRDTFDGTLAAQKFLSCVYRIRENTRFGVV